MAMRRKNPGQLSRVVQGRVISGHELEEFAKKHGLCPICADVQTHEKVGSVFQRRFEPLTVMDDDGEYSVYKGFCIAPTCYSLESAKIELGEISATRKPRAYANPSASSSATVPRQSLKMEDLESSFRAAMSNDDSSYNHSSTIRSGSHESSSYNINANYMSMPTMGRGGGDDHRALLAVPGSGSSTAIRDGSNLGHHSSPTMSLNNSAVGSSDSRPLIVGSRLQQSTQQQMALQQSTSTNSEDIEDDEDPLVKEMILKLEHSDYLAFFNLMDHQTTSAEALIRGFELFRSFVTRDQLARPEGVVVAGDTWVKVINDKIIRYQQESQIEPINQSLLTLLSTSTLPGNYRRAMIRREALTNILKLLDVYQDRADIVDMTLAVIVSLVSAEKWSLNARSYQKIAILIRKLVSIVMTPEAAGREYALRALYLISDQRRRSETTERPPLHDVCNAFSIDGGIQSILDIIQTEQVSPWAVEAGMGLLWRLSTMHPTTTPIPNPIFQNLKRNQLVSIITVLQNTTSINVMEAACGVLANLTMEPGFPGDLGEQAIEGICAFLGNPEHRKIGVSTGALHVFCNLLNDSIGKMVALTSIIVDLCLSLLVQYSEKDNDLIDLIELGCLAIAHASHENLPMKRYLVEKGALEIVYQCLDRFVMSTSMGEEPDLAIKDACLCALASMTGYSGGAEQLSRKGLIGVFQAMNAVEEDPDFRAVLEVILNNTSVSSSEGNILSQQSSLFPQLLQSSVSEDDALSLIKNLRELGEDGYSAFGDNGFDALLESMRRYEYSPLMQEEGCALLAELYYNVPLTSLETPIQLPGGSWAMLHGRQPLDVICNSLANQRQNSGVQKKGLMALINFFSPLDSSPGLSSLIEHVQAWLSLVWTNLLEALTQHSAEIELQEHGFVLSQILISISSTNDLQNWILRLLQHVLESMGRFPSNKQLNLSACELLLKMQGNQNSMNYITESGCVQSLTLMLQSEDTDIVLNASAILASLATNVFTMSGQMARVPGVGTILIDCMTSKQAEPYIVVHIFHILEAMMNFDDSDVRVSITECGGLQAICSSMTVHEREDLVAKYGCRVLCLLMPVVSADVLHESKADLEEMLMRVLSIHVDHPEVESGVMDVLCSLSNKDEQFKAVLMSDHVLQTIFQAMTIQLGSHDLQRSSCSLIKHLTAGKGLSSDFYRKAKRLIGEYGGISAVLNSMLAHNQSTLVQKEGLSALKNLATESSNKRRIAEADTVRVVTYSLWINYKDPLVISSALSALNNIAVDDTTKSVSPLPPEILDIIIAAMDRFPDDEVVHKNACFYLKSCSYLPENLQLMVERAEALNWLLQRAAESFPKHCRDRAQSIMKKMHKLQDNQC